MPKHLGKYQRIAPVTKLYDNAAVKLRRSGLAGRKSENNKKQKRFNITRTISFSGSGSRSSNHRRRRAWDVPNFILKNYFFNRKKVKVVCLNLL